MSKAAGERMLEQNDVDKDMWWAYGLVLLGTFLGFRFLSLFLLTVDYVTFFVQEDIPQWTLTCVSVSFRCLSSEVTVPSSLGFSPSLYVVHPHIPPSWLQPPPVLF